MQCGLPGVALLAQTTAVLRVVGVEALRDQLATAERVVVGMHAGPGATDRTERIAGQNSGPEPGLMSSAVTALPGCASSLLGFRAAPITATALTELGTAGGGTHSPTCTPGHERLPSVLCAVLNLGGCDGCSVGCRCGCLRHGRGARVRELVHALHGAAAGSRWAADGRRCYGDRASTADWAGPRGDLATWGRGSAMAP